MLGGVTIPHGYGLDGHSDADVVLHSVADALLGATGLGDIGELFSDTDAKNLGLDSSRIVEQAVQLVTSAGWQPVNVDLVVHAQQPPLTPHKMAMRQNIARLLGLDTQAVSVKAKTGEGLGPVGRNEAISCEAVILLQKRQ